MAKSVRSTMSLLVTVTSFCVRGGEGVKKGRNFAYVLNGCSLTAFFNIIIFIKSWCMEHIRSASVHYGSGSKVLEMTLTKHRFVAESPLINIKVAKLFYRASVA